MTTIVQPLMPGFPEVGAYAQAIRKARAISEMSKPQRVDYAKANAIFRRQKGQLTRALKSGDRDRIVKTITDHVHEWDSEGIPWPDHWSNWQRALDDTLGWRNHLDLRDL